ncbi:ZrgA family zinc uptake protein [Pseudomonas lurida]|uniref:ZrgA family zinc uptake protein n=1 Tax=Pseudomonas lurida TaxID=244566 RepID=UPI000F04789E
MRRLLLALPFALLPLAAAHAHDDHDHEHGSLGAHEHGVGRLNAVLDGQALELELDSPAMNLVGFEHLATTAADKAKVAAVRKQLENPVALFNLPKGAGCVVSTQALNSPLFGDKPEADHDHDDDDDDDAKDGAHEHHHDHSEIHAHYQFTCTTPTALGNLDLTQVFKTFPATQKIQVQLIGPSGQQGVEATATAATLTF